MIESFSSSVGNDVVKEFIQPKLIGATEYWRSTGHFSSSFLISAAEAFSQFFSSKKKMKVICCRELKENDLKVIEAGLDEQSVLFEHELAELKDLSNKVSYLKTNNLQILYWLLKTDQLEIKIGVVQDGIYHEKYGLIFHPDGNSCFIGGFNLSLSGHLLNSESCVATDDESTFNTWKKIFEVTWGGHSSTTRCYPFPEAAKHVILQEFEKEWVRRGQDPGDLFKGPLLSPELIIDSLWPHQKQGFKAFFDNGCCGILQMATGTGKTKLALAIYEKLYVDHGVNTCILVASRNTLLNQWIEDIQQYFPNHGIIRRYGSFNELGDFSVYVDDDCPVFLLTSYALLSDVEKSTRSLKKKSLIICDEVHNLGADSCERDLKGTISPFSYRLGLSATPDREYDVDGTTFIQNEVGPVIYEYSLEKALKEGILCEFDYVPIEYSLSDKERQKIRDYVRRKNAKTADGSPVLSLEEFRRLVADVVKKSLNKLDPFKKFLKNHPTILQRSVSFVFDKKYGLEVEKIISEFDPLFKYHTFYDDDDEEHLDKFSKGQLKCLITCNKISEGISIRDITTVILFSASRSKTETLQRIGRALRKDPNNPSKIALIVDFIEKERVTREDTADFDRYNYLSKLCREVVR